MRLSPLIISFWIVGFTEQIIDAGVVKAGELNQKLEGDGALAGLVIGIGWLRDVKMLSDFCLRIIVVFAQIANARNDQSQSLPLPSFFQFSVSKKQT